MAANADRFDGDKTLTARERTEALFMAMKNLSVVAEFPDLTPGVRALLETNAALLTRIAE